MWHQVHIRPLLTWTMAGLLLLAGGAWALSWRLEVVARGDLIYTSLALDRQGQPHISAFGVGNQVLTYSRFDGTAWRSEVVDGGIPNSAGSNSSMVLDGQDHPHISYLYLRFTSSRLIPSIRYAHFDGTAWRIETVDAEVQGGNTSIALDAKGQPHISYCDCPNRTLKYARFDGSAWRVETVDTGDAAYTSLKVDAQGRPHISYSSGLRLRYARFDGTAWRVETVEVGFVENTSLVLDGEGRPHIAYASSRGMKYARWDGTAWRIEVIPDGGNYLSLRLDRAGRPLISFHHIDFTPFPVVASVKLARFDGLTWQVETVDSVEGTAMGTHTSLRVDGQDGVHIGYNADILPALKYARGEPRVRLELQLNQPGFRPGETLSLSATVTPGPVPLTADGYVAVALPGGGLLFLQGDGGVTTDVRPLVRDWPVSPFSGEVFRYTFGGSEPAGPYTWLAAFTWPGTLMLVEPLVSAPFTFAP